VLKYLYQNPGIESADFKIGIPAKTVEKLLGQLVEEQMAVKAKNGWRVVCGADIVGIKAVSPFQIAEKHIREMMRFCVQK
jgi:hypothetical protein